jgi:hypothetical protein
MMDYFKRTREGSLLAIQKLDAMMSGVTRSEIEQLSPAHRQRLAQVLRHIADLADPPKKPDTPSSGVLCDLDDGYRSE